MALRKYQVNYLFEGRGKYIIKAISKSKARKIFFEAEKQHYNCHIESIEEI